MIEGIFVEGLIFSIMVLGVLISYRILDLADLTCDSSFATGAAVVAISIYSGVSTGLSLYLPRPASISSQLKPYLRAMSLA